MSLALEYTLIISILLGFAGMEFATRRYQSSVHASSNDAWLEALMFVSLLAIVSPVIVFATDLLCRRFLPDARGIWSGWPAWAMVAVLLLGDDLTQYLWHRASHTPLLWPLHRAHHTASYMSIRVTYRNNFFYYLMMPGLWISGVLLYLGFGAVYAYYFVIKLLVIMGAHCAWRWDEPLYRIRALRPVMWVVQRTISTPATHWAHHALTNADGIGYYKGNFGNLLFLWDVLLGTAHITQQYPPQVGLKDDILFGHERWFYQMFFPIFQSGREHSALRFGGRAFAEAETSSDA